MKRKEYYKYLHNKAVKKWKQKAKEKAQYGDYTIIQYLGKTDLNHYKIPLHRVKLRCKCGFEKIVACNTLYVRDIINAKCEESHHGKKHGDYPDSELLFNSWYSMNRTCSSFLSKNEESTCFEKQVDVYELWKLKEKKTKSTKVRILYKRYEKFILGLLKFSHWSINDLKNKKIRVRRIDQNKDFEPYNLKLYNLKLKKFFVPLESQVDYLVIQQFD